MSEEVRVITTESTVNITESPNETVNISVTDQTPIKVITSIAQGPAGPPTIQSTYTHAQSVPVDIWIIEHNLSRYPSVSVVDSAGTVVIGDVHYDSENQVTLTFIGSFSGKAYLN